MDIVQFLTARLDEAAERARLAQTVIGGDWDGWEPIAHQLPADCDTVPFVGRLDQHLHHNADPARVLAEIEAKRRRLDLHKPDVHPVTRVPRCMVCLSDRAGRLPDDWTPDAYPCETILLDVASYADHPDFDPSWRIDELE